MNKKQISLKIKNKCKELFDECGFTEATFLKEDYVFFEKWIKDGLHDEMKYLEKNIEKRFNPSLLVENTKSIIVVLLNYYPQKKQEKDAPYLISKYAYGKDYHFILKKRLQILFNFIKQEIPNVLGRFFTDSAPVLEKKLAQRAGLGWIGKNSLLITRKGSYFFIGELFLNIELEYDIPTKSFCEVCTKCIDACPTKAIIKPYIIDSRKCISNFTIERKPPIPKKFEGKYNQWIFGCDICQDVCPWNNKAYPTNVPEFEPNNLLFSLTKKDWENLSKETYKQIFRNTPVERRRFKGLKHNIDFLKNQNSA